jgi:hypothetical protein
MHLELDGDTPLVLSNAAAQLLKGDEGGDDEEMELFG